MTQSAFSKKKRECEDGMVGGRARACTKHCCYDENDNNNMSDETKCETNTRNKHFTKHDTNDDVDLDNCVVHTVR